MAERLPVGAARNAKTPSFTSIGSSPAPDDIPNSAIDNSNSQIACQEQDINGPHSQLLSNGSTTLGTHGSNHNKPGHLEATSRNGNRNKESESHHEAEWVEQEDPGVYITFAFLPGGGKDVKRICFRQSKVVQSETSRTAVGRDRARVYEQYNVHMVDK